MNDALKTDSDAITSLMNARVPCSNAMACHPTIQVRLNKELGVYSVGLLGILNGLCGAREDGWGFIAAVLDDASGDILKFERLER